jgi:SNF2 family DNA or RNA helicase
LDFIIENYNKLRPYQKEGVHYFVNRDSALLADEMGLGKTVQTGVALNILFHRKKIENVLIVCPSSLTFNWQRELAIWCPFISLVIIKGNFNDRKAFYLLPYKIWIASYEQIMNDFLFLINANIKYDLVILDEAQRIKNSSSRTSQACKLLSRKMSWALSGTPLENSIDDLISVFSFVKSGLLSSFNNKREINSLIAPFFLRRTKFEVLKDLPPILDQDIYLLLDTNQKNSYDIALLESRSEISSRSNITQLFSIITKLKQICNFDPLSGSSVKYDALKNIVNKSIDNEKKILVFSQYVETLEHIKTKIYEDFSFDAHIFHGGLSKVIKEDIVKKFETSKGFNILLISLKAGGVGLNLNSATIVVMYDRWWNPAVENQAIHRAHRFGKTEPLNVVKFVVSETIEEKIEIILREKQELFNLVIEEIDHPISKLFSKDELVRILKENI